MSRRPWHRAPLAVWTPWLFLRWITASRNALSAALVVSLMPWIFRTLQRASFLFGQLAAGPNSPGPWRLFSPLGAQIHHPLQRLIGQPHRLAASLQASPVNLAVFPLIPLSQQLPLQCQQLGADLGAAPLPLGADRQIADQVGPTPLGLAGGQVVGGGGAIAHLHAGKAMAQQLFGCRRRAAQPLEEPVNKPTMPLNLGTLRLVSTSGGNGAQVLLEQQGHPKRRN